MRNFLYLNMKEFFENIWWGLTRSYNSICCWFRHNLNTSHWRLVKNAVKSYPFDYGYFYSLQQSSLQDMYNYFKTSYISEQDPMIARDLKLAISLLDIINENRDLFHYENLSTLTLIGLRDLKYKCDVYVNMRNVNRFTETESRNVYEEFPHELYVEKARRLYFKLLYFKSRNWWN